MSKIVVWRYRFVRCDEIPEKLKPAHFYYSERDATSAHLCPCGCGSRIDLPIYIEDEPEEREGYHIHGPDDLFTVVEPICNHQLPCCSMYHIHASRPEAGFKKRGVL